MKNVKFLIAVFCLMIFVMADAASAAPSVITADGTTIRVNGKPTFPVSMVGICMSDSTYEPCATSLNRNPNIDYDFFTVKWRGSFIDAGIQDQYKNRGVFATWMYAWTPPGGAAWSDSNQWFDALQNPALGIGGVAIKDQPNFFGYSLDEPDNANNVLSRDQLITMYNYMHSKDPNHPVMVNLCCDPNPIKNGIYGLSDYKNAADILSWDTYPYSNYFVRRGSWTLPDSLYGWEHVANHPVFHNLKDLDSFGKPVSTVIQANGLVEGDLQVVPNNMLRANVYLAVALGVDGIEFWSYNAKPIPNKYLGLVANQAKNAYVQQIAAELKSFESFLVLPRTAYSWQYQQDYTSVSFSNNPSKTILSESRKALNYRLIKDASNTHYLIVVNKDANPISDNTINIQALVGTGTMTAKTIGLETTGSSRAGRTLTVTNGQFTDSFDGYAAHIYQICSGTCPALSSVTQSTPDTTPPTIKITCPSDNQIYNTPSITVVGTASDTGSGVSAVEYSVDSGATWAPATGTTSWSASVTLSSGANTIMFRAIDGALPAGNPGAASSITITYDPTVVFKPALGNFQKSNKDPNTQNNPKITYDAFADGRVDTLHRSSPVQTILEFYDLPSFSWSPNYLRSRFKLARDNADKADYFVFLMEEEIIQPSRSSWYDGWQDSIKDAPGFEKSYGKQLFEGVEVDYAASSETFFLQLLKAWKQLCINLNKKCVLLGDGQSDPAWFYPWAYGGEAGVKYIAQNYDMIYVYSYPSTSAKASCQDSKFFCAKQKIDYWRAKGFKGKINYGLTNEAFGAQGDAVVEADFKNAADAGADIISAYPYKRFDSNGNPADTLATARMIKIWDAYGGSGSAPPMCTVNSQPNCNNDGIIDSGEVCDTKGNVGCAAPTPICKSDCSGCVASSSKYPDNAVAILRQVAVSIYDKNVVNNPNELFTTNINNYWVKVDHKDAKVSVDKYKGYFLPAGTGVYNTLSENEGFLKGIVWAPGKATTNYNSKTPLTSWSIAEEDAQVRYWKMYGASEYFVDIEDTANMIMPRLLRSLESNMNDFCYPSVFSHGYESCPGDCTTAYSADQFRGFLNQGLQTLADELNTVYGSEGLSWKLSIPDNLLTATEYTEELYTSPKVVRTRWHSWCCAWGKNGCTSMCGHTDYTCSIGYARKYTSNGKTLKILVEVTDEKYNLFDSAAKTWVKPKFKFFVEFYPITDNYCNGYDCESVAHLPPLWQSAPEIPPVAGVPSNLVVPSGYTCTETVGQSCDNGNACSNNKLIGSGNCAAGQVCCNNNVLIEGCSLRDLDIITGGCPLETDYCEGGCIGGSLTQVCCKPKASDEITCSVQGGACVPGILDPITGELSAEPCMAGSVAVDKATISDCTKSTDVCCKQSSVTDTCSLLGGTCLSAPCPLSKPTEIPKSAITDCVEDTKACCKQEVSSTIQACSYTLYKEGNQVRAKNSATGNVDFSGTLNQVLSSTAKSGNKVCIKNGAYSLSKITLQPSVIIECESNDAVIMAADNTPYLIYLKSDSTIKGCTFDHKGKTKTIYASGNVKNWRVENNYFKNSDIAVIAENLNTGVPENVETDLLPTSGFGYVLNNKGLHSKLITMEGQRDILVKGNSFADLDGQEYADFNYNVHYITFEDNSFINGAGYSISQEVIDMIAGEGHATTYNTVRNNKIIGNFQSGIRPAKRATNNVIENNYIEYMAGTPSNNIPNIAGIYLYGGGNALSTPTNNKITKNTIIGTKVGIELSGADNNQVTENIISNTPRGIALVKDSSSTYGSSAAPKKNVVTDNKIDTVDYGIYTQLSPDNTVSSNTITNARIATIRNV